MINVKPVKTAIVGCGMISNVYIRNLSRLFSVIQLDALCDMNLDTARKQAALYGVPRVLSMDELLADSDIELVVNLTTPSAHFGVIRDLLTAGKHVFTEKTLAVNLDEAGELVRIANEKGLYLGCAPDTVLGAGLQLARKAIDAGLIGTVTSCLASVNRNQPLNSEFFRYIQKDAGGTFPLDVGVYYVAALLSLMGPVKRVCGFAAPAPAHEREALFTGDINDRWTLPGSTVETGALEFASGAHGCVHFNGLNIDMERPILNIYGTKGILQLGDPNTFCGAVKLIRPEGRECELPFTHGYDGTPSLDGATEYERMYGHRGVGAAEMAWAMRMARPSRLSKEFGFHTLEVILGIEKSSASGAIYNMTSDFEIKPLPDGYYSTMFNGAMRADAERSLIC